jgi:hypothetical protein
LHGSTALAVVAGVSAQIAQRLSTCSKYACAHFPSLASGPQVLDERDALIRSKLGSVKDNTGDVDKFAADAQEILKASESGCSRALQKHGFRVG